MIFKFENFFLLILLISVWACKAHKNQATGEVVENLNENIWKIYQDTKGDYWFGSNGNGVYHLSGKTLKQYSTHDGLIDNTIRGIQEDQEGNIFIESPVGVCKYDGKTFTRLELTEVDGNKWALTEKDLWFNCNGNAENVYRYDGVNLYELKLPIQDLSHTFERFEKPMNYSPYTVFGINKDKAGNMWFGTVLAGAFRFDGKKFLWVGDKELSRLKDGREPGVRSMLEDKNGYMWLSNFISKYKIIPDDNPAYEKESTVANLEELLDGRIAYFNSGLTDKEGNLWMTTYGGGVWKYDGENLFNYPITHNGETVLLMSIYQDRQDTLWLGTQNFGVFKFDGGTFKKFEVD